MHYNCKESMLVTGRPCIERQVNFAVQLLHIQSETRHPFASNVTTCLNHFLNSLNCILTHLHDTSFHCVTVRDIKRRPEVSVFKQMTKRWLINLIKGLVTNYHPFSE